MSGLDAATALFEWYAAMGVDLAVDDAPVDRFAQSAAQMEAQKAQRAAPVPRVAPAPAAATRSAAPPQAKTASQTARLPSNETVMQAREAASSAQTLDELRALLERFDGCNLKLTAKSLVFGDGNPKARLMLVGEAPGRDEDIEGRPFVGRSGQLLDRMLQAIGHSRNENAYIANAVYWRPPGNRDPSDQEVAVCRPFILRQIELVSPDIVVFLGAQPVKALLGGDAARSGIRKLRGHWTELDTGTRKFKALPTYHPAYLLRAPLEKRLAWRDFLDVKATLEPAAR
ncbi:uracil-DNA glycosylase [Oryzibacter oryziterrae]|uniref:uracil-DNA glycosylase n=1 Tax=Oryzibacter oryziterrae TaxID=2766474 RepID=UPI001F2DDB76|nr:uracil-DNA glycosylase [Oryzibacter oryziterrae]